MPTIETAHQAPILAAADLGTVPYADAWARQLSVHHSVLTGGPPTLLLLEHPPVITLSQRPDARRHLLADDARLRDLGIDLQETNRGGDITYHGPGQLVVYPILRLADYHLNVGRYMRLLEEVIIDAVARFGVRAGTIDGCTGVWAGSSKLAALGIRVRRGVTLHGLALNVTTNLAHFQTIIPCGLANRSVTSLQTILGHACPPMDQIQAALVDQFIQHLAPRLNR